MGTATIERQRRRSAVRRQLDRHPVRTVLVLSGSLFGLMLGVHFWMVWIGRFPGDQYAIAHFSSERPAASAVRAWTGLFSDLGTLWVAVPVVVIGAFALWRADGRPAVEGLGIVCLASVTNVLLKLILGPDPAWIASGRAGNSFPSGHVTFVTAVIGYLGIYAWRHQRTRPLALIAALLVGCVGPARVVAGVHLVSDAVGGYLLGGAFLVAGLGWVRWRQRSTGQSPTLPRPA